MKYDKTMELIRYVMDRTNDDGVYKVWIGLTRACRQLSQQSTATIWNAPRKFLAVLS
jgi:hypothetical protein